MLWLGRQSVTFQDNNLFEVICQCSGSSKSGHPCANDNGLPTGRCGCHWCLQAAVGENDIRRTASDGTLGAELLNVLVFSGDFVVYGHAQLPLPLAVGGRWSAWRFSKCTADRRLTETELTVVARSAAHR